MDSGRLQRRRFLELLGGGTLLGAGLVVGHVATALPSQAAEQASREDGAFAPPTTGQAEVLFSVLGGRDVALTFDDGPNPALTPAVLDALGDAGAKATFFMIGEQIGHWPDLVQRVLDEGHEIGNHTWSHHSAALLSAAETRAEIDRGSAAVSAVLGHPPRWYRPPRGMVTGSAVQHAHTLAQTTVMWSLDRGAAADGDAAGVGRHFREGLEPGAIVGLHDGVGAVGNHPRTAWSTSLLERRHAEIAALPGVLAAAQTAGMRCVTLSGLVDSVS